MQDKLDLYLKTKTPLLPCHSAAVPGLFLVLLKDICDKKVSRLVEPTGLGIDHHGEAELTERNMK